MKRGIDLLNTIIRYGKLSTGKGVTVFVDLDLLPTDVSQEEVQEEASQIFAETMQPLEELFEALCSSCKITGVLWADPNRGAAVETGMLLTTEQAHYLTQLEKAMDQVESRLLYSK